MAFPPAFLEEIRNRMSLAQVISRRVRLARKGHEFQGLCPFHNEKSPSFTVNEDKGFFHCFGCGAHGDVIGFEMRAGNLSFPEAVERLAGEAGLEMPRQGPGEREREQRTATLHQASEVAASFFEAELHRATGRAGLDYLRGRGLDEDTLRRFRLGYAPDSRGALRKALNAAGIPDDLAVEAGLLIRPDSSQGGGGGDPYDRFRGRVMFPISDRRGRVIAFGGRTMGDGQPKYLNSPETPLFHKGDVLYGLALAREPAAAAGTLIVCEGYMDVIALHRAGIANAVAPLGTALTENQIALLWRFSSSPIICLDGDSAGLKAAGRAVERVLPLLKPGLTLSFAFVPPPEDPDSLIRDHGVKAMEEVLAQARPLADILWEWTVAGGHLETPEARAAMDAYLEEHIKDSSVRAEYLREFRNRRFAHQRRPQSAKGNPAAKKNPGGRGNPQGGNFQGGNRRPQEANRPSPFGVAPSPASAIARAERLILATLVTHPGFLDAFGEELGHLEFANPELDSLRQTLVAHAIEWSGLDSEAVRRHLTAGGFEPLLERLLASPFTERFVRPDAPPGNVRLGLKWEIRLLGGQIDFEAMENEMAELERSEGSL